MRVNQFGNASPRMDCDAVMVGGCSGCNDMGGVWTVRRHPTNTKHKETK